MSECGSIRRKGGINEAEIAGKAGIAKSAFSAMMSGKRTLYADDLREIC